MKIIEYYTELLDNPTKLDALIKDREKRVKTLRNIALFIGFIAISIKVGDMIMKEPKDNTFLIIALLQFIAYISFQIEFQIISLIKVLQKKFQNQELKNQV